ncbi:MAG: TrkH family potassium uptake protein [Lachnospiraceae bacterium]|jgi:trk system potassium uptake protein TrkH
MEKKRLPRRQLSQTQFIAYGFLVMILIGTLLLMLPIASRSGESQGFLDCLFTAASASCVTGLIIADTWSNWTVFGQLVILTMIQIGGLGFITIGVFISIILRRKIGLKERGLMQESVNTLQLSGVVKLARKIILGTALIEGIGAILLSIRFVPRFGLVKGIYYGIFHSISAFCNAGFDLLGCDTPYMSLTGYSTDWLVNLVIMSLIVIGGLGFIVWDDLSRKGLQFKSYMLHTKIVLLTTLALIFGGALLIGISERDNLMADMGWGERILTSLFASVTARTAGFNTIDIASMRPASKLLTIFLMYIGGSPGSTAGGVKTTTLIVLLLYLGSTIKRTHGVNIFGRRLEEDSIMRASCICTINLCLALTVATIILMMQNLDAMDVLLETFSAIGTVGMSSGITRELNVFSRIMVILLMYCGRIGSLSFALTFTQNMKLAKVRLPEEKITIG